jgi:hypothetical protein
MADSCAACRPYGPPEIEEGANVYATGVTATVTVTGSGVDLASDAILHTEEITARGMLRRLTAIVRLDGDLSGYVLYQPVEELDSANRRLVITGANVFSGTIAGSGPVMLRSDVSRFEVDLDSGEEFGHVHLTRMGDASGAWRECDLVVSGTGRTAAGNPTFDYRGTCTAC